MPVSAYLRIQVLGQSRLHVNDRPFSLGSRHARRLLLYLAINPGPHARSALANLLFPKQRSNNARAYLRQALQQVLQMRPHIALSVDRECIGMHPNQRLLLDYAQFLDGKVEDPAFCRGAITLYQGEFLADETAEVSPPEWWGWVCDLRRHTELKLSQYYETLWQTALNLQDYPLAWSDVQEWMAKQPLRDAPHRAAMLLLAQQGRTHEAIHLYEQYQDRRIVRSGKKPGAAIRSLQHHLQTDAHGMLKSFPRVNAHTRPVQPAHRRFITVLVIALDAEKDTLSDALLEAHVSQFSNLAQQMGMAHGASIEVAADGVIEVYFGLHAPMEDAPYRALQAALELRRQTPSGPFPRLGIHGGQVLIQSGNRPVGSLLQAARAAAWTNTQRSGVVISEYVVRLLTPGEFMGVAVPDAHVYGEVIPLRWLDDIPIGSALPSPHSLVGRDVERAVVLQAAASMLTAGEGRALWIVGEAGIGKTHLLQHIAQDLSNQMRVVNYVCQPHFQISPLHPIAALVRDMLGLNDIHPSVARTRVEKRLREMGETDPLVHKLWVVWLNLDDAEAPMEVLKDYRTLLYDSILELLSKHLFPHPRAVIIEDIHWADAASMEILRRYLAQVHEQPVLTLVTSRQTRPLLQGIARYEDTLTLLPWDTDAAREFLRSLPGWRVDSAREDALVARSGGIPLYLNSLAGMELAGESSHSAVPGLAPILDSQIARAPSALDMLQAAAVFGIPFTLLQLAKMLPMRASSELRQQADRLVAQDLWRTKNDAWSFRHELLREAVYSGIPLEQRQHLHLSVAQTMEKHRLTDPAILAWHFTEGGDFATGARHWIRAARQALTFDQMATAKACFARAAKGLDATPKASDLLQAQAGLYLVHSMQQGYSAAATWEALENLEATCTLQRHQGAAALTALYGRWMLEGGQRGAEAAWRQAQILSRTPIKGLPEPLVAGIGHYACGWSRFWLGDLDAALDHLRQAVALWQDDWADTAVLITGERYREAAIAYLSMIDVLQGRSSLGWGRCAQAVEDLGVNRFINTRLFLRSVQMVMGYWTRDARTSLAVAQSILLQGQPHRFGLWNIFARAVMAWAQVQIGTLPVALSLQRLRDCQRDIHQVWRFGAGFIYLLQMDVAQKSKRNIGPLRGQALLFMRRYKTQILIPDLLQRRKSHVGLSGYRYRKNCDPSPRSGLYTPTQ